MGRCRCAEEAPEQKMKIEIFYARRDLTIRAEVRAAYERGSWSPAAATLSPRDERNCASRDLVVEYFRYGGALCLSPRLLAPASCETGAKKRNPLFSIALLSLVLKGTTKQNTESTASTRLPVSFCRRPKHLSQRGIFDPADSECLI